MTKKNGNNDERRRARRMAVQESFPLFLVVPNVLGMARIYMKDISRYGLSFHFESATGGFSAKQEFEARLYINPAFYLPVACRVVRAGSQEVAVEFADANSPAAGAVGKLQDFFEAAEAAGVWVDKG